MTRRARWVLVATLAFAAACGDDAAPVDGAVPSDATGIDATVVGGLPVLLPCAAGWREATADGVTMCEPWPESGFQRCPDGEIHLPGTPGCEVLGTECPASGWAPDLPSDQPVLYIDSDRAGGDGTMGSPASSVLEASLLAPPGGAVFALPVGTHDEQLMPTEPATIWGACTARTVLVSTTAFFLEAVVDVVAGRTTIRNLSVRGSMDVGAVAVQEGATVELRDVALLASYHGIFAWGGTVEADGLLVSDAELQAVDTLGGGRVTLRRAVVVDALVFGVGGHEADIELEDTAIVDSGGSLVPLGLTLTARRVVVQGSSASAMFAPDTVVSFEDSVLRDTTSGRAAGNDGVGLYLYQGTSATLTRTVIERMQDFAVGVYDAGSRVSAADVVVRDISRETCARDTCRESGGGMAIVATDSGQLTLDRFLITRSEVCGVMIANGATMDLSRGEISHAEIGACVQIDAYDVERLSNDVTYRDNTINLDATALPVPTFDAG